MVRSELIHKLVERHPDLASANVEAAVTTFFDAITGRLAGGGRVELRGFGSFAARARDSRTGHNPRSDTAVDVQAKRVPYFRAGKEMRERLNS